MEGGGSSVKSGGSAGDRSLYGGGDKVYNFIVIVTDDLYHKKKIGETSKDRGLSPEEIMFGKIIQKLGTTKILSLSQALSPPYNKLVTPSPRAGMIYRRHPHDERRYIGVRQYHEAVLDDKRQELCNALRCVGAKSVRFTEHESWNRVYATPVTMQPDLLDTRKNIMFKFLRASPTWQAVIKQRLDQWSTALPLEFIYDNDLLVNDSIVDTMLEKLDVSPKDRDDLLGPALHARTMLALEQNKVHQLYEDIQENVSIEFFGKEDYKRANQKWIKKNWGPSHVETFLAVSDFHEYVSIFRDNGIDGRNLLKLTQSETLVSYLKIPVADAVKIAAAISTLGDIDKVEVLATVAREVENVRAHKFTAAADDWEDYEAKELRDREKGKGTGTGTGAGVGEGEKVTMTAAPNTGDQAQLYPQTQSHVPISSAPHGLPPSDDSMSEVSALTSSFAAPSIGRPLVQPAAVASGRNDVSGIDTSLRAMSFRDGYQGAKSPYPSSRPPSTALLNLVPLGKLQPPPKSEPPLSPAAPALTRESLLEIQRNHGQVPLPGDLNRTHRQGEGYGITGISPGMGPTHSGAPGSGPSHSSSYGPLSDPLPRPANIGSGGGTSTEEGDQSAKQRDSKHSEYGGFERGRYSSKDDGSREPAAWEKQLGVSESEQRYISNRDGSLRESKSRDREIDRDRDRDRDRERDRNYNDSMHGGSETGRSRTSRRSYRGHDDHNSSRSYRDHYRDHDRDRDVEYDDEDDRRSSSSRRHHDDVYRDRSDRPFYDEERRRDHRKHRKSKKESKSLRKSREGGESRHPRVGDFSEDELEEMTYKVVMVGIVGVGKKSLMRRFGGAEFTTSEISKMAAHFLTGDVERFLISSWDESGQRVREQQEIHRTNVLPFTKRADVLMVVYDITNAASFKYLPDIMRQILSSGTMPWASLVLVGNKLDQDQYPNMRQVHTDQAFDLCRKFGFGSFFETSALSGANVTEVLSVVLSRCEQDRLRELARLHGPPIRVPGPQLRDPYGSVPGHPGPGPGSGNGYGGSESIGNYHHHQHRDPESGGGGSSRSGLGFGQGRGFGPGDSGEWGGSGSYQHPRHPQQQPYPNPDRSQHHHTHPQQVGYESDSRLQQSSIFSSPRSDPMLYGYGGGDGGGGGGGGGSVRESRGREMGMEMGGRARSQSPAGTRGAGLQRGSFGLGM